LPADFIPPRVCILICEIILTLPFGVFERLRRSSRMAPQSPLFSGFSLRRSFRCQDKKEASTSKSAPAEVLWSSEASLMYRPCHLTRAKRILLMSSCYSLGAKFSI